MQGRYNLFFDFLAVVTSIVNATLYVFCEEFAGTDVELRLGQKTISTLEKTKVLGDFPKVLTVFLKVLSGVRLIIALPECYIHDDRLCV